MLQRKRIIQGPGVREVLQFELGSQKRASEKIMLQHITKISDGVSHTSIWEKNFVTRGKDADVGNDSKVFEDTQVGQYSQEVVNK